VGKPLGSPRVVHHLASSTAQALWDYLHQRCSHSGAQWVPVRQSGAVERPSLVDSRLEASTTKTWTPRSITLVRLLLALSDRIWEGRIPIAKFVAAWRHARECIEEHGSQWAWIRGPVGAAAAMLQRMGAKWKSPFVIGLLDNAVDLRRIPPLQLKEILRAHARRQLDRELIEKLVEVNSWQKGTLGVYKHGIDWELLRNTLNGKVGGLAPAARRALHVVAVGAFWPEERRWSLGVQGPGHGTCVACLEAIGNDVHRLYTCGALQADLMRARWAGELPAKELCLSDEKMRPLQLRGLAPIRLAWQPAAKVEVIGDASWGHAGCSFGDGSGEHQDCKASRAATGAVVRTGTDGTVRSCVQGVVAGWFPTVPRAELEAYLWHLQSSLAPATYIGDCKHVIDGAQAGVPERLTGARSMNADLWRQAAALLADHGPDAQRHLKTKAHRSRSAARASVEDPEWCWVGNAAVDEAAKRHLRNEMVHINRRKVNMQHTRECERWLQHLGTAAEWCFRHWPEVVRKTKIEGEVRRWRPDRQNGHDLRQTHGGGWKCKTCGASTKLATGARRIVRMACAGGLAARSHPSHRLSLNGTVLWCRRCGAYAESKLRCLAAPCLGRARSDAYSGFIVRFRQGLLPAAVGRIGAVCKPQVVPSAGDERLAAQSKRLRSQTAQVSRAGDEARPAMRRDWAGGRREERPGAETLSQERELQDSAPLGDAAEGLQCVGSLASVRRAASANCGCGAITTLGCKRCDAPVCLKCAKAKVPH
jgi:hypothetical protein